MEMSIGFVDLIKLLGKLIVHKYEERQLATNNYEIINTNYGRVKGMQRKNAYDAFGSYYAFEGIPYAKPPLAELRFRAPVPPEPWDGVLDCLYYKSKPLQVDYIKRITLGSEDCLYLNVYAKKLRSDKPLPVMVWIYGGGFQVGEASREIYGPDYLMQKDVVLVSIAYRLGALGFLSLNDPDLQVPGNAGLKDQVMALKWIKENIHFFNGDPNNITLFGESAGAASTHFLMLTQQTKGLFHKAILQSGTALNNWANTPPRDWPYRLACAIGYKGNDNDKEVYRFLTKQDGKKLAVRDTLLLTKQERLDGLLFVFGPVIEPYTSDDCIVNRPLKELMHTTWSNEIPAIIGGTSFEGLFQYGLVTKCNFLLNEVTNFISFLPDDVIAKHSPQELKAMSIQLKQAHFGQKPLHVKESLFEYLHLISFRTFWHSISRTIKARAAFATQTQTYCYVFDFDSDFFNHFRVLNCGKSVRGVSHGDDISYLFNNVAAEKLSPTSAEFKCLQRMVGMWYNFALSSNPNCKEIEPAYWQPIDNKSALEKPIKILNISDELEFKDLPLHRTLQLWDSFYTKEALY